MQSPIELLFGWLAIVPEIASAAPGGERCAPSPAKHSGSAAARTPATVQCGSAGFRLAVSRLRGCGGCRRDYPTGDADPLALAGIQGVLAIEVPFQSWPPAVSAEIRELIREMSCANCLWGAARIHGELLKLGIQIAQSTVAKYVIKRPRRPGQGWTTFLRNHADGIAAADLFVVPTIGFKLLYGLVILGHGRRRLIHHAVTTHPTAEWIAQQIVEAFPWDKAPEYLVRDRDAVYGEVTKRRLRGLGIRDRPTAPRSPKQNAHVERPIGLIRRECTDHVIVLGETHLRRIMSVYAGYYNEAHTHLALRKDEPVGRSIERHGRIIAGPVVGGLHHRYARI
jgi:transposase InsO family protein